MSTDMAHSTFRHGRPSILAFGNDMVALADVAQIGPMLDLPVERIDDVRSALARLAADTGDVIPVLALGLIAHDVAGEVLEGLADHVRRRNVHAVAIVPVELLDLAMACADDLAILCAPEPAEIAAALALLASPERPALHDEKNRSFYPELRQLSDQVLDIARTLARLTGDAAGQVTGRPLIHGDRPAVDDTLVGIDAAYVRAIIRGRRLRDNYFSADLFADPAWDMLLDLTAARLEQRDVAVSSLCIAAAVPPTTALRWIKTLTDSGIFVRALDPDDGRRAFIALSDAAANGMMAYLAAARRISSPIL